MGAGGRRERPFYFIFLPCPFIPLQALIIEGLNLSCSCLPPSLPDSISNKGLWFGFGWLFFSLFPSRDLRPVMRYQHPLLPTALNPDPLPHCPLPLPRHPHSFPVLPGEGGHPTPAQGMAASPRGLSWEVNTIELQGRAACKLPPL